MKKYDIGKIIRTLIIGIISFTMLYPFLWMFSASFTEERNIFNFPFRLIPDPVNFEGYKDVLIRTTLGHPLYLYMYNTIKISLVGTIGAIITCSLAAYGFTKIKFPGRDKIFILMLATMMIPIQITMLPNFIVYRILGITNSHAAVWIPFFFGPIFSTFFMRQYFLTIPTELNESSEIDGASHMKIFTKIMMPLAKPAVATITIFNLMGLWNSYDYPLLFLRDSKLFPMTIALKLIAGDRDFIKYAGVMAGSVMFIIPLLVVFIAAQKYFTEGITMTGVKG